MHFQERTPTDVLARESGGEPNRASERRLAQ